MRFVLYSPDPKIGIYLGNCMGMGFWSLCDPAGQPSAVTFATESEAAVHVASWDVQPEFQIEIRPVEADDGMIDGASSRERTHPTYASVAACVAAGLPAWDPDDRAP